MSVMDGKREFGLDSLFCVLDILGLLKYQTITHSTKHHVLISQQVKLKKSGRTYIVYRPIQSSFRLRS